MAYQTQTWVDEPTHTTPLSADRLLHIEQGIAAAANTADAALSGGSGGTFDPTQLADGSIPLSKLTLTNGFIPISLMPPNTVQVVRKAGSTWPARPTTRTDIIIDWEGADPSPTVVTSGTAGMYAGDRRSIPAV